MHSITISRKYLRRIENPLRETRTCTSVIEVSMKSTDLMGILQRILARIANSIHWLHTQVSRIHFVQLHQTAMILVTTETNTVLLSDQNFLDTVRQFAILCKFPQKISDQTKTMNRKCSAINSRATKRISGIPE